MITFSGNIVKTGYKLNGTTAIPLEKKITVRVEPPNEVFNVVITLENNNAYAEIVEGTPDTGAGTLEITVKGNKETPVPSTLKLKAEVDGVSEEVDVQVVIPKTHTSVVSTAAPTYTNTKIDMPIPPNPENSVDLYSKYETSSVITIKDQYGEDLPDIYDGNKVVDETFSNSQPNPPPLPNWPPSNGPITNPNGDLVSGKIDDTIYQKSSTGIVQLTFLQGISWLVRELELLEGGNTVQAEIAFEEGSGLTLVDDINLDVQGHRLDTKTTRTMEMKMQNVPPLGGADAFVVTDVVT